MALFGPIWLHLGSKSGAQSSSSLGYNTCPILIRCKDGTKHPTVREIPGNATAGGDIPSGSGGSQGIAVSNVFWWHRVCSRNI